MFSPSATAISTVHHGEEHVAIVVVIITDAERLEAVVFNSSG
jgi:hypothetical protein